MFVFSLLPSITSVPFVIITSIPLIDQTEIKTSKITMLPKPIKNLFCSFMSFQFININFKSEFYELILIKFLFSSVNKV